MIRQTLNPAAEIMPDRCMSEYEALVAKMGPGSPTVAPEETVQNLGVRQDKLI
jgi:hypothetical protein